MKKELKVIAVVLAGIIVFLAGFGLGTSKGITIDVKVDGANAAVAGNATQATQATQAPAPVIQAPAPATEAPATEAPATTAPAAPSADASKPADNGNASAPAAIPSSPSEIAAKYNEVINALKKTENVTIHKVGAVNIECTECSVGFLKGMVNSILKSFMSNSDDTIQFTGGKGTNSKGEEKWVNDYITPSGRDAAVTENDLASATAVAEGSGYKMTLVFKSEQAKYDGASGTSTNPTSHMNAMDPLNLATLELPMGAEITNADMTYPGATVEATVDGSGKITKLVLKLPLEGRGTGNLKGASLTVGLKGNLDDSFDITY